MQDIFFTKDALCMFGQVQVNRYLKVYIIRFNYCFENCLIISVKKIC